MGSSAGRLLPGLARTLGGSQGPSAGPREETSSQFNICHQIFSYAFTRARYCNWLPAEDMKSQILKRFTKKQYHSNHYFCLLLNKLIYELNSFEVLIFRDLKGVLRPNILELQWWKGSPASTEHDSERNESRICTLVCVLVLWRDKTGSGFGKT